MKKCICLVTDWYPTKDNPFRGVFFKEQAFAVSEYFDFVVVHFNYHFKRNLFSKPRLINISEENNTIEYTFDFPVSAFVYLADLIEDLKINYFLKKRIDGIGSYASRKHKKVVRDKLVRLFDNTVKEKIDVFYCIDAQREAFFIQCLSEKYNKPYIVSEHAPVPWPGELIKDINKYAIENANLFIAISNDKIRQTLLQNIKIPKTVYLGNYIDETKLLLNSQKHEIKTFIIVAANSFYKNYDLFIMLMNRLSEITDCPFKVMIVGYGSNLGYSKDPEGLEKQIKESKFANNAVLIPYVPHEKIGETLNQADAFIMTSIQEGQPVSALEAACCGLPVFSTRCGGVEDYIDSKMGRLYSVNDYEGMAQDLKLFLEDKLLFDSAYIREQVISRFGNRAFINNFYNTFNKEIEQNCSVD